MNDTDLNVTIIDENQTKNGEFTGTYHFYGYSVVIPLAILMMSFMVLAIGGNTMVILTIARHQGMKTRTNVFIINLAVVDILVAVLDMPMSLTTVLEGGWVFGKAMCQLNGFTMALFLICSIHTLMYISIHKYISITRPFSRAMTTQRIKMMIAAAWIWSFICASGPLVGWSSNKYKKGSSQCGPAIPLKMKALSHSLFITATNYFIPLTVMTFCYFRIFREIHKHMNRIRETSNIDLESSVSQQKKVSVTLFLVLACFLLCWTPFVVYSTTLAFMQEKEKMPLVINPLAYWCLYMNSACNPIIYAFRSPSFRKGYKEIMCGYSTGGLTANSLSFRSRSARGSIKSNSNVNVGGRFTLRRSGSHKANDVEVEKKPNPKRMLSQTSWMSIPIIPYIFRSTSNARSNKKRHNRQISQHTKSNSRNANNSIPEEASLQNESNPIPEEVSQHEDAPKNGKSRACLDDAVNLKIERDSLKDGSDFIDSTSNAFVDVVLESHVEGTDFRINKPCESFKSSRSSSASGGGFKGKKENTMGIRCLSDDAFTQPENNSDGTFQDV